jgi:ferredoxin
LRGDQLCSNELDPSDSLRVTPFDDLEIGIGIEEKRKSYVRATCAINESRSTLIRDTKLEIPDLTAAQSKGKLLLYWPLESVVDGAASAGSRGFFDIEDAPPWDTWFSYSGNSIFCWVPESLVQNAQDGIDANPVDCIHWCDWSKLP